jgi:hypothetical protein
MALPTKSFISRHMSLSWWKVETSDQITRNNSSLQDILVTFNTVRPSRLSGSPGTSEMDRLVGGLRSTTVFETLTDTALAGVGCPDRGIVSNKSTIFIPVLTCFPPFMSSESAEPFISEEKELAKES